MRSDLSFVSFAALTIGLAIPGALAQSPAPRFLEQSPAGTMRGSKIIGVPVIGMDHVRVGAIEDVLVDGTGRVQAVVIGVGGFLGVGEKTVAVPFDQLSWNVGDVSLTSGPTSVVTPANTPDAAAADKATPENMPGSGTTREVLGSVQNQESGRVTEATGSVEPTRPTGKAATVLAGGKIVHAEIRLTKAQLDGAPAFRFEASDR